MKQTILIAAVAALALTAPATAQQSPAWQGPGYGQPYDPRYDPQPDYGRDGRRDQRRVEALYGVEAAREAVRIRVSSNGCTRKQDFQIRRDGGRGGPEITFMRVRPDNCRAIAPGGVWLTFDYRELGLRRGEGFNLGNPFTPWIGPGRG